MGKAALSAQFPADYQDELLRSELGLHLSGFGRLVKGEQVIADFIFSSVL